MAPWGFEVTSYTTRLTPFNSLIMRPDARARNSALNRYASTVIPSRTFTTLISLLTMIEKFHTFNGMN